MILSLLVAASIAGASDACSRLIPPSLASALSATYPQYRQPRADDQHEDNVKWQVDQGGSGCLGVAEGDFDGDHGLDIALLLERTDGRRTRFVVALRREAGWQLELIETVVSGIGSQYLDVVAPGLYVSGFYGGEYGKPAPNQRKRVRSATQGVAFGTLESTASYYFRVNGQWVCLWMSD